MIQLQEWTERWTDLIYRTLQATDRGPKRKLMFYINYDY